MTCVFCNIVEGKIPAKLVLDEPELLAFRDINPVAPSHVLVIPKRHIATLAELTEAEAAIIGKMFLAARRVWTPRRFSMNRPGRNSGSSREFEYAAATWDRPRRVIVKAEHLDKGANPRFVVTNLPGDSRDLYEDLYCQRGQMENRIKEQQLGLFADRTSCHDFVANQFRVLLSAAAYVLMETLRREGLAGTELETAQVDTIRLKVLKIGARIVCSVRRIVIHLARGYPLKDLLRNVLERLTRWTVTVASG